MVDIRKHLDCYTLLCKECHKAMDMRRYEIPKEAKWTRCKSCEMEIVFIKNEKGNTIPVTRAGINHFIDCPEAMKFRKDK